MSRDFAKVTPNFWLGDTGRALRDLGHREQVVAMYLLTSPHANVLGLYFLPIQYLAHEIGSPFEGASEALARVCELGFCTYDAPSEMVWVYEMARFQLGDRLSEKDKRTKHVAKTFAQLPACKLLDPFFKKYGGAYHLPARGFEGASKGLPEGPSKGHHRETETETETEKEKRGFLKPVSLNPDVEVKQWRPGDPIRSAIDFESYASRQGWSAGNLRQEHRAKCKALTDGGEIDSREAAAAAEAVSKKGSKGHGAIGLWLYVVAEGREKAAKIAAEGPIEKTKAPVDQRWKVNPEVLG